MSGFKEAAHHIGMRCSVLNLVLLLFNYNLTSVLDVDALRGVGDALAREVVDDAIVDGGLYNALDAGATRLAEGDLLQAETVALDGPRILGNTLVEFSLLILARDMTLASLTVLLHSGGKPNCLVSEGV